MECCRLRLRGSHIISSHRQTKSKREIKDVVNQKNLGVSTFQAYTIEMSTTLKHSLITVSVKLRRNSEEKIFILRKLFHKITNFHQKDNLHRRSDCNICLTGCGNQNICVTTQIENTTRS